MSVILIVDDEPEIRKLIRIHMEDAGLQVIEAESGNEAIECLREQSIDLVILDLMMNNGNGFDVMNFLRNNEMRTIILALSARREVHDKITTLGYGADDYVTKPFSPQELLARVQAHLRRHYPLSLIPPHTTNIKIHQLVLEVDNLVLYNEGKRYTLTQVECDLLRLFMVNPDRILTKREIYKEIWQHENYDDNNLSVFVSRLRKLLNSSTSTHPYIQTVRGVGYRFSGDGL